VIDYDNGIKIPFGLNKFREAPSGSVLMCIEGGSAGKKIGLLNTTVCFGNKLCCFNPIGFNNKYLYYFLQSPVFVVLFKNSVSGIIDGVSINRLKRISLFLPPLAEQHRIVDLIEKTFEELDKVTMNIN